MAAKSTSDMANNLPTLPMCHWGNPILRQVCTPITTVTDALRELAIAMIASMYDHNGVGLAAPQIGRTEQLCVIDVPEDAEKEEYVEVNAVIPMPLVMFNPEILSQEGEQTDEEGCLSFPSIHAPVTRANKVCFTFIDIHNQRQTYTAYGLLARAVQHELEHLRGGVFIDNVADRAKIEAKLTKLENKTKRKLGLL